MAALEWVRAMVAKLAHGESVVVVGNGMASHTLCRTLVEGDAAHLTKLTVIGEEPQPAYNRVRLGELWTGLAPAALELSPRSWYSAHGITLCTDERATRIDRGARELHTCSGRVIRYDRLVLATGSRALRPPVPGIEDPACFVYRSIADLLALQRAAAGAKRCAVLGGGLLGLEAAKLLVDSGLLVHVVEGADGLMPRQLDAESGRCLRAKIEQLGVQVHLQTRLARVERCGSSLRLELANKHVIEADLLVLAAGVKPRDELAVEAGLTHGARGGVVVNDLLVTSDPRIFAVGECASHRGQSPGLREPCQDMARVLAQNFLGEAASFERASRSCRLKLMGVEVAAVGDYGGEHRKLSAAVDDGRRSLLVEGDRIVGALAVGHWPELPEVEQLIAQHIRVSRHAFDHFVARGALGRSMHGLPPRELPDARLICNCASVTAGELRRLRASGVHNPAVIVARTGATLGCGSCKSVVAELLGASQLLAAQARSFWLPGWSMLALLVAGAIALTAPIPFAQSVADAFRAIDALWRDSASKRWSGFITLGVCVLGFGLSVRKRVPSFRRGPLGLFRALHAIVGLLGLMGVLIHTGMRLGHNLNLALMLCFLAVSILGGSLGLVTSLELKNARALRRYTNLLHLAMVWPLPVLLTLHVLATYYF